jgi:hypothetical protein
VIDLLRSLFGRRSKQTSAKPNLPPGVRERFRQLSSAEQQSHLRRAEESAARSLLVDPSRDFATERDSSLAFELTAYGDFERAFKAASQNPGERRASWTVIVGQDDPPRGPWGWRIVEAHSWPPGVVAQGPVSFPTREAASAAGETDADALWGRGDRHLAGQ